MADTFHAPWMEESWLIAPRPEELARATPAQRRHRPSSSSYVPPHLPESPSPSERAVPSAPIAPLSITVDRSMLVEQPSTREQILADAQDPTVRRELEAYYRIRDAHPQWTAAQITAEIERERGVVPPQEAAPSRQQRRAEKATERRREMEEAHKQLQAQVDTLTERRTRGLRELEAIMKDLRRQDF